MMKVFLITTLTEATVNLRRFDESGLPLLLGEDGEPDPKKSAMTLDATRWGYGFCIDDCVRELNRCYGTILRPEVDTYAVLEQVGPGLLPLAKREYWFHWNGKEFTGIQKPESLKHLVSFCAGTQIQYDAVADTA